MPVSGPAVPLTGARVDAVLPAMAATQAPQLALFDARPAAAGARLDLSLPGSTIALHGPGHALTVVNACLAEDGRLMWLVRDATAGGCYRGLVWSVSGEASVRPAGLGPGIVPPYRWFEEESRS